MRILVGYLATPQGEAALHRGIEEARLRRGDLVVVHARQDDDRIALDVLDQDRDQLAMIDRVLQNEDIPHEVVVLPTDENVSEQIIALAAERAVDLIVIGIRSRSAVGKLLLGSNAQDLILHAPCPVLSVRAD